METISKKINVGSRKTSTSKIVFTETGKQLVNGKTIQEYFKEERFVDDILRPLKILGLAKSFKVSVKGGGISAQSWATRYAMSRLLASESEDFKKTLRANGLLSGDSRSVERKKVGRYKARAKFPFSRR